MIELRANHASMTRSDASARGDRRGRDRTRRSIGIGFVAGLALAIFYVIVVRTASGSWTHLRDQMRADWYLLVPVMVGFVVQVALLAELRRRRRMQSTAAAAGGAGVGASTAGMVACCAHHITDLVPFLGLTGAATFLYDFRVPFILVGIGINTVGVALAARRLHGIRLVRSPLRLAHARS